MCRNVLLCAPVQVSARVQAEMVAPVEYIKGFDKYQLLISKEVCLHTVHSHLGCVVYVRIYTYARAHAHTHTHSYIRTYVCTYFHSHLFAG